MWRTVIVNNGEKLTTENGWLVVTAGDDVSKVPIEDVYALIINNYQATITLATINALTKAGAHICFCDEKHIPAAQALPQ